MMANESALRPAKEVRAGVLRIAQVMNASIDRGCGISDPVREAILPGGLKVRRRAPALYQQLLQAPSKKDVMFAMDWVNVYAMAENEEHAANGQVVTAPTNGASGLLPAALGNETR